MSTPPLTLPQLTLDPGAGMELLPDGVVAVDSRLRITAVNGAACRLAGRDRRDLVGERCIDRLHPRDRDGEPLWAGGWPRSAHLRSVTRLAEQTITIRCGDGHDAAVCVTGTYLRGVDGALSGALLCLRDASRRFPADPSGIEIVSTVSHELRSPLTSLKGYTGLLLKRWGHMPDDQRHVLLEQINRDAARVSRLINELLVASRLECGRPVLHPQLVDLPRLAASVVDKVRLEHPSMKAETAFAESFPKLYIDPDKVEQILINLVENACKYGSPEGLRVEGVDGEGFVSVAVIDRGEGIPAADLRQVFAKSFRRSTDQPTGSGLGLWISRGIVEAHGGTLVAESNPGAGTTFRFTLPKIDLESTHEP